MLLNLLQQYLDKLIVSSALNVEPRAGGTVLAGIVADS